MSLSPSHAFVRSIVAMLFVVGGSIMAQVRPHSSSLLLRNDDKTIIGLWLMGQSLCDGSESLPIVTPADTGWGNLRFKRGVRTWVYRDHGADPEKRKDPDFSFVPLTASINGGLGETIANGLADHLKHSMLCFTKDQGRDKQPPHFLVAYAGQGGRTIEELSIADISTDPRTPAVKQHLGGYYKTSLDDARRAKAQAGIMGKDFAIAALVWMQGEGNGGPTGGLMPTRWDAELPRVEAQAWYRDRLIAYRKQWSADLRAITGQREEIPMFTYQTLGPAGPAQLMAADADPHIIMVGPHYMVPSAINSRKADGSHGAAIHLSADGERWYGGQVAKVMHRVLVKGEDWQPLRPRRAWLDASRTNVLVDFIVPRPPLVLDDKFLPLQQDMLGKGRCHSRGGFQVRNGAGAPMPINDIEVDAAQPTRLRIRLAGAVAVGERLHLSAGQSKAGVLGSIKAVSPGAPTSEGMPTTELIISGHGDADLSSLLQEGAFFVANGEPGAAYAQATVRQVVVDEKAGTMILRYEDRELRNGVPFKTGLDQTAVALRPFSYTNLRDSDEDRALHSFGDEAYGQRKGQPYPLWNWCVLFDGMAIEDPK